MFINKYFQEFRAQGSGTWWQEVNNYCRRIGKEGWNTRITSQLLPIHLATYMLLPQHYAYILTDGFME